MPLDRSAGDASERCVSCPKLCRPACPVGAESARETLTPWGKMTLLHATVPAGPEALGLPGRLERVAQKARSLLVAAPLKPLDSETAEAFYGCTGCLRCRTHCDHANDVPLALLQGRSAAVEQGLAPAAAHAIADRFARHGHARSDALADAVAALEAENPAPAASSVLFAGCDAPLSSPSSLRAVFSAARRLGAPLGLARGPLCCGRPLFEAGYRDAFRNHVEDVWERLGDREIVVPDAACARSLTEYARAVGVEPRGAVTHATTYLARRLGPDVQAPPLDVTIAYHDPCHLARGLGEYEAPRRLLAAAVAEPVREAPHNREDSVCCGAGGLVPRTYPDLARAMAMTRADELRHTGARRIATACPSCRSTLADAGLDVVDVVELFAEWLGGARGTP